MREMLTGDTGDKAQWSQDTEGSESFDIKPTRLPTHVMGVPRLVGKLFQNDTKETVGKTE